MSRGGDSEGRGVAGGAERKGTDLTFGVTKLVGFV